MGERLDHRQWSDEFARALAAGEIQEPPPAPLWRRVAVGCAAASHNRALTLLALAVASVLVLLLLRPPFVMAFEYDQRRPWRGGVQVSWLSVICVTAMVVMVPVAVHLAWPT